MIEALGNTEIAILNFIRENIANPVLDGVMRFISASGEFGIIWIALLLTLMVFPKTRKAGLCGAIAIIIAVTISSVIVKPIVARPRPFTLSGAELIVDPPTDFSFPSGHTLSSVAVAVSVFVFNRPIGIPALIYALLMGFSRLYLYVHFPTDVLCGLVIGIITAIVSALVISRLVKTEFLKKYRFFKEIEE